MTLRTQERITIATQAAPLQSVEYLATREHANTLQDHPATSHVVRHHCSRYTKGESGHPGFRPFESYSRLNPASLLLEEVSELVL